MPAVSGVVMGLRNKHVGQLAQRLCSSCPLDLQYHMNLSVLACMVKNGTSTVQEPDCEHTATRSQSLTGLQSTRHCPKLRALRASQACPASPASPSPHNFHRAVVLQSLSTACCLLQFTQGSFFSRRAARAVPSPKSDLPPQWKVAASCCCTDSTSPIPKPSGGKKR